MKTRAITVDTAKAAIEIAAEHAHKGSMSSSAQVSLSDAREMFEAGRYDAALRRSMHSVEYSVGRWSPAWNQITENGRYARI